MQNTILALNSLIVSVMLFRILSDFPDAVGDYGKCKYREHGCDEDNQ